MVWRAPFARAFEKRQQNRQNVCMMLLRSDKKQGRLNREWGPNKRWENNNRSSSCDPPHTRWVYDGDDDGGGCCFCYATNTIRFCSMCVNVCIINDCMFRFHLISCVEPHRTVEVRLRHPSAIVFVRKYVL